MFMHYKSFSISWIMFKFYVSTSLQHLNIWLDFNVVSYEYGTNLSTNLWRSLQKDQNGNRSITYHREFLRNRYNHWVRLLLVRCSRTNGGLTGIKWHAQEWQIHDFRSPVCSALQRTAELWNKVSLINMCFLYVIVWVLKLTCLGKWKHLSI